jgi:hypothetical protein
MTIVEMIEACWQACLNKQKWDSDYVRAIKQSAFFKLSVKQHFQQTNPHGEEWVLYNWFIGTAFGVGINHLKAV